MLKLKLTAAISYFLDALYKFYKTGPMCAPPKLKPTFFSFFLFKRNNWQTKERT